MHCNDFAIMAFFGAYLPSNHIKDLSGWLNNQPTNNSLQKTSNKSIFLKMLGFIQTCTLVFILQNYFKTTGSIKCYICNMMKQNTVQVSKKFLEEYTDFIVSFVFYESWIYEYWRDFLTLFIFVKKFGIQRFRIRETIGWAEKSTNNMTNSNTTNYMTSLKLTFLCIVKYENMCLFLCRIIDIYHTQKNILKRMQNLFLLLFFLCFDSLTFWIWSNITFIRT